MGNNIKFLEKDSFVSLTELNVLFIRKYGLRTIELGAFNGLTKLTELTVKENEIREILAGTFENLNNLKFLQLYNNGLKHLDRDVFCGLYNLKEIQLELNEIEYLDSALFRGLINLKSIDLQLNRIQYLHSDMFLGLLNLQFLNLHNNPGLQVPTDRNFIISHSLSHLVISECNISSLSVETFANVSALESLNLGNNNLITVNISILKALPKLSILLVHDNPLQCDCQLQEVWRWCEDRNIQTGYWGQVPECDTPNDVKGMGWGVLEKGQCLDGDIQYCGDYNNTSYSSSFPITDPDTDPKLYSKEHGFVSHFLKQYLLAIYAVPFLFGTTGNVILLITIILNKDMRTVPNKIIVNLAISDIIYLTILFSEVCASTLSSTWFKGDILCKFLAFCRRMSVSLSAYFVALYSIQRYLVTVDPFCVRVTPQAAHRVFVATICGVWIVATLFAVPSALSDYLCQERYLTVKITYYQLVVIFELLVSCVLPLFVIAVSYIMTARHLEESFRAVSGGTQNPLLENHRITSKIVVVLGVVLLISYVPYHVFWNYFICTTKNTINSEQSTNPSLHSYNKLKHTYLISTGFLLINPCLIPVAVFWTRSSFKEHLNRYLACICKRNAPHNELALTRRN